MAEQLKTKDCVIGAGIAGLILATRLVRAGRQVLILDQGPDVTEADRAALLARSKQEFRHYSLDYNSDLGEEVVTPTAGADADRLFGTGGTALHFEGFMIRPVEDDHRVRSRFGYGRDWPLSFEELEPWLGAAEREVGVAGDQDNPYAAPRSEPFPMPGHAFSWFDREHFGPALAKLGMTGHSCPRAIPPRIYQHEDLPVRPPCAGCRFCKFCPTGARYSPDRVHGVWLKRQAAAEIRNGLSLRRLELSADGRRVVAAHAKEIGSGKDLVITAERFVLATGGIATPRLLLLSAATGEHAQGIGNAGGQVGVGFSGHSYNYLQFELGRETGSRLGYETMSCEYGRAQVDRREEPSWFLAGMPSSPYTRAGSLSLPWARTGDRLSMTRLRESLSRIADLVTFNELGGTGSITLDTERRDVFGDPLAHIHMPLTEWDLRSDARAHRLGAELGQAMGAVNTEVTGPVVFHEHPSGAAAMGTSPDDGVCDRDLKVFGVENLHLVGNAVFPHMGANPPTLTIAALALRLAAHLESGA